MAKSVMFGALGALLVVGVVIGVVTQSRHKTGSDFSSPSSDDGGGLHTSSKSVSALCASTDYKDSCERTLGPALNGSASPEEAAKVAIGAIVKEAEAAMDLSVALGEKLTESMDKDGFEICQKLLANAVDEAKASLSQVHEIKDVAGKSDDILTWLSAIISYKTTCLDEISDPELRAKMDNGLVNTTELTSNALAIVDDVSTLLGLFKNFGSHINGRRLMGEEGDDETHGSDAQGYPRWMSTRDRKLLATHARNKVQPHAVVAQDGSGNFKTITDALNGMPKKYSGRYVIYVKAGVYKENVIVTKEKVSLLMYGDGSRKTVVTGNKSFKTGTKTFLTATFANEADGFIALGMGFKNTAGPEGEQAVALRVKGDMSAFYNCRMDAFQDTLYVQAKRQFYRSCTISGTIDFIFGDSSTVIQNSRLVVRRPLADQKNLVTAQGRDDPKQITALVIHNCRILPDKHLFPARFQIPSYLGRPWKRYSRTIIMESLIGDFIRPEGWLPWDGNYALDTLYYAEYGNTGPGSGTSARVNWRGYHVIDKATAQHYAVDPFLNPREWLTYTGIKYTAGLS